MRYPRYYGFSIFSNNVPLAIIMHITYMKNISSLIKYHPMDTQFAGLDDMVGCVTFIRK